MNWRRGLLRTWLVISICWSGAVGGHGIYKWYNDPWRVVSVEQTSHTECDNLNGLFAKAVCEEQMKAALPEAPPASALWVVFFLSVGPPAALLLLGAVLFWIGQGFRERM